MPNGNGKRSTGRKTGAKSNGNGNGKPNGNGNRNGNGKITYAMVPRARPRTLAYNSENSRPVRNRIFKHSGSDFVGTVTVRPGAIGSERILASWPISPSAFPGTRLTQFAALYEFYRFTSLKLRYVPAVPVTLACQLVLYVDLDPKDDPSVITNSEALIRQAVAQTGAQQWNFHTPKCTPLALRTDQQFYFTGEDRENVRFTRQGVAYLIQVTDPVDVNGGIIQNPLTAGSIFFDWSVDFNIPQINPEATLQARTEVSPTRYQTTAKTVPWTPSWLIDPDTGFSGVFAPRGRFNLIPAVVYNTLQTANNGYYDIFVDEVNYGRYDWTRSGASVVGPFNKPIVVETDSKGVPLQKIRLEPSTTTSTYDLIDSIGFEITPATYTSKLISPGITITETT